MKIVLLYPPPWKIVEPGKRPYATEGAPQGIDPSLPVTTDVDTLTCPNGVLSLAAQAMDAGHEVSTYNLYDFPWGNIEALVEVLDADVFGLSCFTGNRRGMAALAALLRERHPQAHITVGGPHVTALAKETLRYVPAIDTVVIGEGEATFADLVQRLEDGKPVAGLPGLASREGDDIIVGPPRQAVELDTLTAASKFFPSRIVLTSRGCPFNCSFCGSEAIWGRKVRYHSVDYTLDMLQTLVEEHGLRMLAIKDDTFSANRKRATAICQGIIDRGINFLWSCDTRANCVSDEVLRMMRLAGCQRVSIGVESADPDVLETIGKRITPEQTLEATRLAQKYGMHVRYYMILGNRGETHETLETNLNFIREARPNEVLTYLLTLLPGTEEYTLSGLPDDFYFTTDLPVLQRYLGDPAVGPRVVKWLSKGGSSFRPWRYGVADRRAVLDIFPEHHATHFDLGVAYAEAGQFEEAETFLCRAGEMDFPIPALIANNRAVIAFQQGKMEQAASLLEEAQESMYLQAAAINAYKLNQWRDAREEGPLPTLDLSSWQALVNPAQPVLPGPFALPGKESDAPVYLCGQSLPIMS